MAAAMAPHANAQAVFGSIIGTVTDNSGAVVPGAKITIKDVNRGTVLSTTTNDSGNYTQTQLSPGTYTVSVEKPGFRTFTQQNVTVTVGLTARVDSTLEVGGTTQEITVSEAPPGLATDRAEVNSTLGSHQITDLPVFNRNFTNLTLLVPGATINTFQHAAAENPQAHRPAESLPRRARRPVKKFRRPRVLLSGTPGFFRRTRSRFSSTRSPA